MDLNTRIILLVEDDENDVFFMRRALHKANLEIPMHVVMDGQAAVDYLQGTAEYADRTQHPLPDLVLLDLKLPYLHGFEVLEWIRQQPLFRELPVIVLTSSPEERDRRQAAALGAQAYCVKPPTREMVLEFLTPVREDEVSAAASPSIR